MSDVRLVTHWMPEEHGHLIAGCPECHEPGTLAKGVHSVTADGTVNPSFICPHCGWHGWVRLHLWAEQVAWAKGDGR